MKALILAAGYATRLYPLTRDFPKPLLAVGPKTILDYLVDQLEAIPEIDGLCLITNHRFAPHFESWRQNRASPKPVEIIDDGTTANENRLGAVGDIQLAIQGRHLAEDLLVSAADNLFRFSLGSFVAAFLSRRATRICVHALHDLEARRRTGIAILDAEGRVLEFAEKPPHPQSTWAVPPLYLYPEAVLPRFKEYLDQGHTTDAPGNFIQWLIRREPVYAHPIDGAILDIGSLDSLERARSAEATSQR